MSLLLSFLWLRIRSFFFFFNDTATTEIYTLSLHDALPISLYRLYHGRRLRRVRCRGRAILFSFARAIRRCRRRSEEHTSELQSQSNLVCRLLLEKKKNSNTDSLQHRDTALVTLHDRVGLRS